MVDGAEEGQLKGPIDSLAPYTPLSPNETGLQFHAVSCPSTEDCFVVAEPEPFPGGPPSYGEILATHDGGVTWKAQKLPSSPGGLIAISCPSTKDCVAVGEAWTNPNASVPSQPPAIATTTNSGQTWQLRTYNGE